MAKYLLAQDLGTSGNKATLFKEDGQIVLSEVFTYKTYYSQGNFIEQKPEDWWTAVKEATRAVTSRINPADIAAVSFSGQMQGCVCVDKGGNPLYNSLIWSDQRASKEVEELLSRMPMKEFYSITGFRMSAANTVAKLMWVKRYLPEVYGKTYKVLNAKDYIIFKLTGKLLTDYTDASGTCGMDLVGHKWSQEVFEAAGLDITLMPELHGSTDVAGKITGTAALECGLLEGTPVICGGGDGVAAGIGAGCIEENDTYCCMGTSAWIAATRSKPIFDENMTAYNLAHMISKDLYMPCGAMSACGPSYDWFLENFASEEKRLSEIIGVKIYDIMNLKVSKSPAGAKGLLFLPYLLGERSPRWNSEVRGAFIGITIDHNKEDMLRAVMEGVALNLSVIFDLYKKEYPINKLTIIGGCANDYWSQICADVFDVKCNKINYDREATSIGAAVAAGVGVGMFKDFTAINKFIGVTKSFNPDNRNTEKYRRMKPIFDDAYNSLVKVYSQMAKL